MIDQFLKDPAAVLDYRFDWAALTNGTGETDWLATGETISTSTVTATSGLTVDSSSIVSGSTAVVAWLSGGTAGQAYEVTNRIVTSGGRTDERTITLKVTDR